MTVVYPVVNAIGDCTTKVNVVVAVCPVVPSVTVTVYVADAAVTVGVPDSTPVEAFTDTPVGNDGLTAYERVPRPPVTTGV